MPGRNPEFSDPNFAHEIVNDIKVQVESLGLSMTESLRNALSTQRDFMQPTTQPKSNGNEETEA